MISVSKRFIFEDLIPKYLGILKLQKKSKFLGFHFSSLSNIFLNNYLTLNYLTFFHIISIYFILITFNGTLLITFLRIKSLMTL